MRVKQQFVYLNNAMPLDGRQYFILGIQDSDGPFALFTTKITSGFFIDDGWFQQPHAEKPGLKIILVLQSHGHGMQMFNWTLPLRHTLLDKMYVVATRTLRDPPLEDLRREDGILVFRECPKAEYDTILWFDRDVPHYDYEWWPPYEDEKHSNGDTMQVAP